MKKWKIFLFFVGLLLLLLNMGGVFVSLRNNDIYQEKTKFENDITLTYKEAKEQIDRKDLDRQSYIKNTVEVVKNGMAYVWDYNKKEKYNITIPARENWLLFLGKYFYPAIYNKYEYCNPYKALERGVGICSQQTLVFVGILTDKNIPAKVIGLKGHIISTVEADEKNGEWWVVDADYGVIINKSIQEIEKNPELIKNYYEKEGYGKEKIEELKNLYQKDGNKVYQKQGVMGYTDCNWKKYYIEKFSYYLIWIIPIFMIFPYVIFYIKKINNKK